MNPQPGELIGNKYRIVRLIGDGGMGSVHEAHHELLGTSVALKFLHPEIARRPGLASRFLQEARVSARIQSPHVTRVTDVDQTPDGSPFLVMELLTGESLQQLLDRRPKLPKDQAIDFALQILAGLEAAHALGVVHRDLKPDNVFITPSSGGPILKLLDFGIAKLYDDPGKKGLTRPGAIMGTPEYMAPEQLYSADRVDHRADLFSLGVMLYEMLSGERPAYGDDAPAIVGQITAGKVKRLTDHDPALGEKLAATVHKAIAADKGERYESAMAMRLALAPFAGELSQMGRIAATPAPAAVLPSEPPPKKQDKTEELPPLKDAGEKPAARGGVAKTLPPDDEPPAAAPAPAPAHPATVGGGGDAPQGSTQEASKELIAELSAQRAAQQAAPARTSAPYVGAAGGHYAAPPAAPPMAPPKRKSGVGAVLALLLGLAVTGGLIALVVAMREQREDPPPLDPIGTATPSTTITAQGGDPTPPDPMLPPSPAPAPAPGPAPGPGPTGTGKPKPKTDAGAQDAGQVAPFPTFPLPSGLPPLPSGFPPIPTTFPQIPGLPPAQDGKN